MKQLFHDLNEAGTAADVKGVVITGKGKYYSAGVDLSSLIKPMAPSTLIRKIRDENESVFRTFLDFPKPIVAAVNGPAIGAAVTSTILMDRVIASKAASFSLPFARLGVPPEGCSSVTFAERMGEAAAQRMLGPENWIPSGQQALDAGLIDEVVDGDADMLVARAVQYVRDRVASGGARRFDTTEHERLSKVNSVESAELANAFVGPHFLNAMYDFNTSKKKTQNARFFWLAKMTLPLWKPAAIAPSHVNPLG
jgi:peroxisomal 3,2-trans-enoyl-CoA isomerase